MTALAFLTIGAAWALFVWLCIFHPIIAGVWFVVACVISLCVVSGVIADACEDEA